MDMGIRERQKGEVRSQKGEVRSQKGEVRSQKREDRREKLEEGKIQTSKFKPQNSNLKPLNSPTFPIFTDSHNKAALLPLGCLPTAGIKVQIFQGNAVECLFNLLMEPIPDSEGDPISCLGVIWGMAG